MATYFIDANRGSDSNNGLSPSSAWQNPEKIDDTAYGAGTLFLLADDSTWTPAITSRVIPPTSWTGSEASPIIIGKYSPSSQSSSSNKPTIEWNHDTAESDWSATGTANIWNYKNTSGYQFSNGMLIRIADSWDASAVDTESTPGTMSAVDGRFFASSTNVYLYAPSNPVAYYGSVVISPGSAGYFTLSSGRKWITVQDLHFKNTGCGILLYSGNSTEVGFVAERISGRTVSNLIAANADPTGVLKAWIRNCDIRDFGSLAILSAGSGGFTTVEIYDNTIIDGIHTWAQGGIYLVGRQTGFSPKVYRNYVAQCGWGTRDKEYDGCAIYAEAGSNDADIYNNVIEECYVAFQDNSGRKATFRGNVINRCWSAIRVSDQSGVGTTDHNFYNNTCIVGASDIVPSAFGSSHPETGTRIYKPSGADVALNIRNNIFHDVSGANTKAAITLPQVGYTGSLDTNWINGYAYEARLEFSPFTSYTTAKVGTGNPEIYPDYRPRNARLFSGGANLGGTDLNGNTFPSNPSIGAVQCVGVYPRANLTTYQSNGNKISIAGRGRR